jgi:hypothetical protein
MRITHARPARAALPAAVAEEEVAVAVAAADIQAAFRALPLRRLGRRRF